jgi:hypothetical protein
MKLLMGEQISPKMGEPMSMQTKDSVGKSINLSRSNESLVPMFEFEVFVFDQKLVMDPWTERVTEERITFLFILDSTLCPRQIFS